MTFCRADTKKAQAGTGEKAHGKQLAGNSARHVIHRETDSHLSINRSNAGSKKKAQAPALKKAQAKTMLNIFREIS